MFNEIKNRFPYHGDISRVIRNAIKAINKGVEFSPEGNLLRINDVNVVGLSISAHLAILDSIKNDDDLKKLAQKNADSVNEAFYVKGIHSKNALNLVFSSMELSNIIQFKWVEQPDQNQAVIVYIEKTIYPPRLMKVYFNEYVKYFCNLNRLQIDISGTESNPIYRITKQDGGVFI